MQITRRAFARGLGGAFGSALVPTGAATSALSTSLAVEPGIDDAYEKILCEYIRVEEAAIEAGRMAGARSGAATWEGQQLENFIAELDGRIDIKTTARQIYAEFKERFREAAEQARGKLKKEAAQIRDSVTSDAEAPSDEVAEVEGEWTAVATDAASGDNATVERAVNSGHVEGTDTGGTPERL